MEIEIVIVGELDTNCYILSRENDVLIIDPGDEWEKILAAIKDRHVMGIIITHHHFDHVGALEEVVKNTKAKVYNVVNLQEGKNTIGKFNFEMLKTPGHKEDAICLIFDEENCMFSGDFIFKNSIGRWDLPGGSAKDMKKSIEKIIEYANDLIVYPGHGDKTILKNEKDNLEKYAKYF